MLTQILQRYSNKLIKVIKLNKVFLNNNRIIHKR